MEERDTELIARAIRGEEAAFHQLVNVHAQHLFAVAYAMTGNASDAEDMVQETFLAAFQGLSHFQQRSSLRTWLVAVLVRQVALLRRRRRNRWTIGLDSQPEELAGATGSGTGSVDARLDVTEMLRGLSPEHREVLVLREYEGLSYDEIATALDVPRGTVESRLYRARQELRTKLTGYTE